MATKTTLASTLYRAILSSAKRYAQGAQKRNLPAKKEMEMFNSVLKSLQLQLPDSGIMTPQIATTVIKKAFRQPHLDEQQLMAGFYDGFAVLRKLRQREKVLNYFPLHTISECFTDGCKVDAKSRYMWERPPNWYTWEYTVKIVNPTDRTFQLFIEKLRTVDENLEERNLEVALIGSFKQETLPVIKPGEHFEFTKRMHFRTKSGFISGSYTLLDVHTGQFLQAQMSPMLLTSNVEDEILQSMHASLNSATDGDEEAGHESQKRGGARRRRLRREVDEKDSKLTTENCSVEGLIPDSELKLQIRRGLYHKTSSSTSIISVKFRTRSSENKSSARRRAIQRATPVSAPTPISEKQEGEREA